MADETDTALGITVVVPSAQVVTLGVATEADVALPIHVGIANAGEPEGGLAFLFPTGPLAPTSQTVVLGVAEEADAALPIDAVVPSSQIVLIGVAEEIDSALRITRIGGANAIITMNMQMPEGTPVGAYLTHEWIGTLVPQRKAGSYAGPVIEEQSVNEYGEVTFLTLPPGEYVAWTADFPLKRRFFVVTPD